MYSNKKIARIAGLCYLVVVLTGIFSLAYIPSRLVADDDAGQTFRLISAEPGLFRLSIVSSVICYLAFMLLPLVLYKLFRPIQEIPAKLMVIFALASVPMALLNLQHQFDVLSNTSGEGYLKGLTTEQLQSQVMLSLSTYGHGLRMVQLFWGLWLLPLGYLIWRSGLIPRVLGILLMLGCAGYLVSFTCQALLPGYNQSSFSQYVRLPASIGEIGTCLWLLIMGAKNKPVTATDDTIAVA
jgi:hypothetical protein